MSFVKVDVVKLEDYNTTDNKYYEILLNTYAISELIVDYGKTHRIKDSADYSTQSITNRVGSYHYVKLTNGTEYVIPFDCDLNNLLKVIKQPTIEEHDSIITLKLKQGNYVPNYEDVEIDLSRVKQIYIDENHSLIITYGQDDTILSFNDLTYNLDVDFAYSDLVQRWEKVLANEKKGNSKG